MGGGFVAWGAGLLLPGSSTSGGGGLPLSALLGRSWLVLLASLSPTMAPSPGWLGFVVLASALNPMALNFGHSTSCRGRLPTLGRHERRRLTHALNQTWASPAPALLGFGLWRRPSYPCFPCRASRHLHPKQRGTWDRRLQRRCGFAGVRVGEIPPNPGSDPDSLAMEVDGGQPALSRVFCPVAGCPHADSSRARGWANHVSMRHHIDAHLAGSLYKVKSPLTGSRPKAALAVWLVASACQSDTGSTRLVTPHSGPPSATHFPGNSARRHANSPPCAAQCPPLVDPDPGTSPCRRRAPQRRAVLEGTPDAASLCPRRPSPWRPQACQSQRCLYLGPPPPVAAGRKAQPVELAWATPRLRAQQTIGCTGTADLGHIPDSGRVRPESLQRPAFTGSLSSDC